jgi:hypothetical protein
MFTFLFLAIKLWIYIVFLVLCLCLEVIKHFFLRYLYPKFFFGKCTYFAGSNLR